MAEREAAELLRKIAPSGELLPHSFPHRRSESDESASYTEEAGLEQAGRTIVGISDKSSPATYIAAVSRSRSMGEQDQTALFEIEGPDEDGCVWICSAEGREVWCQNLGPVEKAAEAMSQWLGSIDYLERS